MPRPHARRRVEAPVSARQVLWRELRGRRLGHVRFARTHPVGPYFVEFACPELGIAIELDDGSAATPTGHWHGGARHDVLAGHGYQLIRFWEDDVLRNTEAVVAAIWLAVMRRATGWNARPRVSPPRPTRALTACDPVPSAASCAAGSTSG